MEGSHDAIIEPAEWQLVQTEIQRKKNTGRSHNCCSPFSAKLKCGDCGEYFGFKVWHSNSKYKRTVWQCNAKFKGESRCVTPHLYEQRIKELFFEAVSDEMEVTAGADPESWPMRTPPGNLTSTTTTKSMTGMPAGTPHLRAGWTAWKKSRKGRKSSMIFSVASLRDLAKRGICRWISTRSCSTGLWITQRSIRTAGWFSLSAMG